MHGLLLTAVQLVVMAMFFHIDLSHANLLTAIVLLLVGSISFIGFGIMAAVLPMLFTERGAQMAYIIRAILLLLEGAITIPIGLWVFHRAELYAKRTGKLKRNG